MADLNERLRSHLARMVATPPNPGFEDRVAARLAKDRTPGRAWLGQVLAVAAVVIVAVGLFVVLRAGRENVLTSPNPRPSVKPAPTPSSSAGPAGQLTFASVHMMTPAVGWAMTEQGVVRTTDGWAHWRGVGPPDVTGLSAGAQFLSAMEAWVVAGLPQTPRQSTIFHTTDGGSTWSRTPLLDPAVLGPGEPDFIDATHGWLFLSYGVAAGSEAGAIYRTVDGGKHWTKVEEIVGSVPAAPGSLPFGCDKGGVSFVNQTTGWASGSCAGGPPFFYVTHDAGKTWTSQPLSLPGSLGQQPAQWSASTPIFFDARSGYFLLTGGVALLYTTSNGGETWTPHALPTGAGSNPFGANQLGGVVFSSPVDGWLFSGEPSLLLRTNDGGQHWTTLQPIPRLAGLQTIDVLDAMHAIAVLNPSGNRSVLWTTDDGGRTWRQILP